MNRFRITLGALALVLCGAFSTHADTLSFTETITASGKLDGASFTNALVTLTLTGNTSSITNPSSGLFHLGGPATVSIAGGGSDTFADNIVVFSNEPGGDAGFIDLTTEDILDTINSGFNTYALATAIGPLSGYPLFNPDENFNTTSGTFDIASVSGDATFTAKEATTAVPEASSLLMLALGLAGILSRRKTLL